MATPTLVSVRDYTTSRYAQMAENTDGQLTDILARAETAIQTQLGRTWGVRTYVEQFRTETNVMFLMNRPIQSVTQIRRRLNIIFPWYTIDLTYVSLNNAASGYLESYPYFSGYVAGYEVEVTYTAGYPTLPEDLKEAILMQAVLFSYQDLEIYGSGDSHSPGILYFWQDIARIIDRYKATSTVHN